MELSDADAAAYRARARNSTAGRLAALGSVGSCKPKRGGRASAASNNDATARLVTLGPTHHVGIRDIADCLRCCAAWPGCRYATFTPRGWTECSLYRECDLGKLTRQSKTVSVALTEASRALLASSS